MGKRILIFGATSAIAVAVARLYASRGGSVFGLISRHEGNLQKTSDDLGVLGAQVAFTRATDLCDVGEHVGLVTDAMAHVGIPDVVLFAQGVLPDQAACERGDIEQIENCIALNCLSVISLASLLMPILASRGKGTLVFIGSVAGDRGRKNNYVYGASKSALEVFAAGLRARLRSSGVSVLFVKPGFVQTPMTRGFDMPKLLVAEPVRIARGIVHAIDHGRHVVYLPWFWRPIMFCVRHIPSAVLARLSI